MTETTARYEYQEDREQGLNWPRIAGISAAIAVHVAALMLLMAPVSPPPQADEQEDRVDVQFIERPPPPPPPPPPPKEPPKQIKLTPQPPQPQPKTVTPPPPEQPPIITDTPRAVDVQAPPPSPPAPPTQPPARPSPPSGDLAASMCTRPSPQYPREAMRAGITGTVKVLVQFANSGAITNASVQRGSGNRDLDRAAVTAVKRARLCPGSGEGSGFIDINFTL